MNNLLRRFLLTAFIPFILLLSACNQSGDSGRLVVDNANSDMAFNAPQQLLTPKAINQDNLILLVTIGTSVTEVRADENGEYRLVTQLPENSSTQVTLEWFEIIGNEALLLAVASKPLVAGTRDSPAVLVFNSDEFDTSADDDNDGFSNLVERRDGFLFDDPDSPIAPPVLVNLDVEINLPDILEDASSQVRSQLFAEAFVNGDEIFLSREGDFWRGQAVVTENTSPLVRINFYATAERQLRIVNRSRSRDVFSGGTTVFGPEDYVGGIDPLNQDGDKFNNAEELVNGTNPEDRFDPDFDGDELSFGNDNCPRDANPGQEDIDSDGIGDACDPVNNNDLDNDGVANEQDNCPSIANSNQADVDRDGEGDVCDDTDDTDSDGDNVRDELDNCPSIANSDQADLDRDGKGDVCDDTDDTDTDGDTIRDELDNCPLVANLDQADLDGDEIGNVCDNIDNRDTDGDDVPDVRDNCPAIPNPGQANLDGDADGDACDTDRDGDTVLDDADNCPIVPNLGQANLDGDADGDACDTDRDGDTVLDDADNCPIVPNLGQANLDGDADGDACDTDRDGDTVLDDADNCPIVPNLGQANLDGDADGDACDTDRDGDTIPDVDDNCPDDPNMDQANLDGDTEGDVCDATPNGTEITTIPSIISPPATP